MAGAASKYDEEYRQDYGLLKLLGMPQAVRLEDVYTGVRFLDELSIRRFESLEALEQNYRESQRRRFQNRQCVSQDGMTVANKNQYLMVLGGPGAGKSTFLRKVGLEALKGKAGSFQHECIPVFLELKRFDSDEIDLTKSIAQKFQNAGLPLAEEFAAKALEKGKLLILLDGLDEVPKVHLNAVVEAIQDFVGRYDKNRFMASCRIAAHRSTWNRFIDIELADFDDEQIKQFICNWFQSDRDQEAKTAEKCWEILNELSNQSAKELAHTPLLLTFLCLVYDRTQGFPSKRATLYRKALDILLEEWAAEKRIQAGEIYKDLNTDLEKVLLAEIAYNGFVKDQLFFTEQELVEQIKVFLADTVDKPKYLDGKAVLDAIVVQQGILVERAEGIFSFSHLTLQEYLTAQYLSQNQRLLEKLVSERILEKRWQEVFLLVSGLLYSSNEFLEFMERLAQDYANNPKLKDLLSWAHEVTANSSGGFKPAIKRVVAVIMAITPVVNRVLDPTEAISFASTLYPSLYFNMAIRVVDFSVALHAGYSDAIPRMIDCINALEKSKTFTNVDFKALNAKLNVLSFKMRNSDSKLYSQQFITNQVYKVWINALCLQEEWLDLSELEERLLNNYLYINKLIVKCKEAAVRVSQQKWDAIEARMLTVQSDRT